MGAFKDAVATAARAFADVLKKPSFAGTPFPSGGVDSSGQLKEELGGTGTFNFGGFIRGEDFNPEMDAQTAIKNFDEMRRSDSQVHAALEVVKLPIRTADYELDPSDPDDPQANEIAEFVQWNLFDGMTTTWDDLIRQALLMLDFGFMLFEKVWTVADDGPYQGRIVIHKLAPRPPRTLWQWFTDEDGALLSIKQLAVKSGTYQFLDIPASKLVRFTYQQEGDNFTGISMLRSAYPHWLIKKNLYLIDAIRATRFGVGIPRAKLKPGYKPTTEDRAAMALMLQGLSSHQHAYLIEPEQVDIDILMPQGVQGGAQLLPSIQHQNEQITRNILAQFLDMGGKSQGGSRALGASAMDFFLNAIESIADQICDVINKQVIKDLVDMNFEVQKYPTLRPVGIQETDVKSLAAAAQALAAAGLLTPDKKTENTFRNLMNLPEVAEDTPEAGDLSALQGQPPPDGQAPPNGGQPVPTQPPAPPSAPAPAPVATKPAKTTRPAPAQANTTVTAPTPAATTVGAPTPANSTTTGPAVAVKPPNVQQAEGEYVEPAPREYGPAGDTVDWDPKLAATLSMDPVDGAQSPAHDTRFIPPQKPENKLPPEGVAGRPANSEPPTAQPANTTHDPREMMPATTTTTQILPANTTAQGPSVAVSGTGGAGGSTTPARTVDGKTQRDAISTAGSGPWQAKSAPAATINDRAEGQADQPIRRVPQSAHMARSTVPSSGDADEEGHSSTGSVAAAEVRPAGRTSPMAGPVMIAVPTPAPATTPHTPTAVALASRRKKSDPTQGTFWRDPTPLEARVMELREIPRRLDTARSALLATLQSVRKEQISRIASAVAHARPDDSSLKAPLVGKMAADIKRAMQDVFDYGHGQVVSELKKQGLRAPHATSAMDGLRASDVAFAGDWDEGKHPRGEHGRFGSVVANANVKIDAPQHLIEHANEAVAHVVSDKALAGAMSGKTVVVKPMPNVHGTSRGDKIYVDQATLEQHGPGFGAAVVRHELEHDILTRAGVPTGKQEERVRDATAAWGRWKHASLQAGNPRAAEGIKKAVLVSGRKFAEHALAAPKDAASAFLHLEASASLSAQSASDKLLGSARAEALRLRRAGWDDDEIEDALLISMGELSDGDIARLAAQEINEAFSMGRVAAAEDFKSQIETAVYSAILDNNVCDTCEQLDGQEFDVDSDEYEENMPPNPNCDGGDNCRCTYIYQLVEDAGGDESELNARERDAIKLFEMDGEDLELADWDESKHPRGHGGRFGSGEGKDAAGAKVKLTAAKSGERAFTGEPAALQSTLSKQETGKLGEELAGAYVRDTYKVDVNHLNYERNNFPVDLLGDHRYAVEVKTGLASNGATAQQWRMTIGQPGKAESAWLAKASPNEKAAWNEQKQLAISDRKAAAIKLVESQTHTSLIAKTVTMVVNPDKKLVDVYEFNGFHDRIGWKSPEAHAAYKGTFRYKS